MTNITNKNSYDIIKSQYTTEKTTKMAENGKYTFDVDYKANKVEIKKAIEEVFKVHVIKINVVKVRARAKKIGKYPGLTPRVKKAIVTLQNGETLNIYEV